MADHGVVAFADPTAPAVLGSKRGLVGEETEEAKRARMEGVGPEDLAAAAALSQPGVVATGTTRVCFPFLNKGVCKFGVSCKYRHIPPDHPEAAQHQRPKADASSMQGPQPQPSSSGASAGSKRMQPSSAGPGDKICFPWLNHGKCERGAACKFRHLDGDHPDAVADRMRTGAFNKIPKHANPLIDQNPMTAPGETRICYTFLNKGACARADCTFRHLLEGHPDAVADRLRNGKYDRIPEYARPSLQPALPVPQPLMPQMAAMPPPGELSLGDPMAAQFPAPAFGGRWQSPAAPAMVVRPPVQLLPPPNETVIQSAAPVQGEARLCFPFVNKGWCERGANCRFRHPPPDHPDVLADRARLAFGRSING